MFNYSPLANKIKQNKQKKVYFNGFHDANIQSNGIVVSSDTHNLAKRTVISNSPVLVYEMARILFYLKTVIQTKLRLENESCWNSFYAKIQH